MSDAIEIVYSWSHTMISGKNMVFIKHHSSPSNPSYTLQSQTLIPHLIRYQIPSILSPKCLSSPYILLCQHWHEWGALQTGSFPLISPSFNALATLSSRDPFLKWYVLLKSFAEPRSVWLSGLSASLWTIRCLVWILVRAHAWVVAGSPVGGMWEVERQPINVSLLPSLPPFPSP